MTVVNKGTVVRRRNSAFSEREQEEMGVPAGMTELVRRRSGLARIRRSCDVKHIPDNASKLKDVWSRRTTVPINHRPH